MKFEMKLELLHKAREVAEKAYCPYSKFHVGASVLCASGHIYVGHNIENASYGLTVCAERVAIFKAISEGEKIEALAVSCPDANVSSPSNHKMPCGACRQVMNEFMEEDCVVFVDGVGDFLLKDISPYPFVLR